MIYKKLNNGCFLQTDDKGENRVIKIENIENEIEALRKLLESNRVCDRSRISLDIQQLENLLVELENIE